MIVLRSHGTLPSLELEPMTSAAAGTLGPVFAGISPWSHYPFKAAALTAYLAAVEPDAPRYLIRVDDKIAGAFGLRNSWLRGPYLQFLGIVPLFQRHGIGHLVLSWVEDTARATSERNLWVAASEFNEAGLRFYERHGFSHAARLEDLVVDGTAEILLRKRLPAKN
ncbi:MAG: GNAT family N-acetyltransferase [Hyphomicrobium sp.]|nr:GNAT family N-acetyltransferase [Hyphomicrobium sp.]